MTALLFGLLLASVLVTLYAYVGYPLLMRLLARSLGRPPRKVPYQPSVSLILAVHNEERTIERKLRNMLELHYPRELLEIIVVSDACTDGTDDRVASYHDQGIRLISVRERGGKHHAQRIGIAASRGEILAFTDVAPLLDKDALREMVANYADPEVGCVSSEDSIVAAAQDANREGEYINYEMALRRAESLVGSVVGLSGSFFSARRSLCDAWWLDRSSDFFTALQAVRRGYRAVMDSDSLHYYTVTPELQMEYRRKVRTVLNGLVVFFGCLDLLNPLRYGLFSLQLVSHKLLRWCLPFLLATILVTLCLLAPRHVLFAGLAVASLLLAALGFAGLIWPGLGRRRPVHTLAFFALTNLAIARAWYELLLGRTFSVWEPTQRHA